jgi:hypothetical protein
MAKTNGSNNQKAVLLVNSESKEITQLRQDMPDWLWIEAPEGWPFAEESKPVAQAFRAIIVFAKQGTEAHALAICKHICEKQTLTEVPLLVAGSRYQMALGHAVKRLSRGDFIFTPIEQESLLKTIEKSQSKKS